MSNSLKFPMFFMIFSYFWHELRRGLFELRRVLNLSSAGIDSSSAGFDLSSAGLLDYGMYCHQGALAPRQLQT